MSSKYPSPIFGFSLGRVVVCEAVEFRKFTSNCVTDGIPSQGVEGVGEVELHHDVSFWHACRVVLNSVNSRLSAFWGADSELNWRELLTSCSAHICWHTWLLSSHVAVSDGPDAATFLLQCN